MDGTSEIWALQSWRDKLAAAFTHSAAPSGDKLGTLTQLAVFAAQHGMIWVGLGLPPTYAVPGAERRHEPAREPPRRDGAVGARRGRRARGRSGDGGAARAAGRRGGAALDRRGHRGDGRAEWRRARGWRRRAARRRRRARGEEAASARVGAASPRAGATPAPRQPRPPAPPTGAGAAPHGEHLAVPAAGIGRRCPRRSSARTCASSSRGRSASSTTCIVCATLGNAQLEIVTASEPLYFGHVNISDEFALALPSGDPMVDRLPLRTFISDAATGVDLARYKHRTSDLVLHPGGYLHWPGRLQPAVRAVRHAVRACGGAGCRSCSARTQRMPAGLAAGARAAAWARGDVKLYAASGPPMQLSAARVLARDARADRHDRARARRAARADRAGAGRLGRGARRRSRVARTRRAI